jgi:hypothetical protein
VADTLPEALAALVRCVVRETIQELHSQRPAEHYTSSSPPPGITRRRFNARCKSIPEARLDGKVWVVPVEAYQRSLKRPIARAKPQAIDPIELLRASGMKFKR